MELVPQSTTTGEAPPSRIEGGAPLVVEAAAASRERSAVKGRDSGGGEGERCWRDPCVRGAKRMDDDVEALLVVAVGLDVPLKKRRGVAPAGSVLEVGEQLHAA